MDQTERFDETLMGHVEKLANADLSTEASTAIVKNLEILSKVRPPVPDPVPEPDPEPTTFWGKARHGVARALDNETTRTFIKAGGAFAGVAVVAYSTIHRDHVMERQALDQANQRPS